MRFSCPQIYAALCEYGGLLASLSSHLSLGDRLGEVAAEIQNALIWGEYRHGSHSAEVSAAVEDHLVGVLASSDAALFHNRFGADVSAEAVSACGSVMTGELCGAVTPLYVEHMTLQKTGCLRTAELVMDMAAAHADYGAVASPLPTEAPISSLFAATAMAGIDAELERRLPGVAYLRRGFDVTLGCNSERAIARASVVLSDALAAKGAGVVWCQAVTSQGAATLAPAR